MAVGRRDISTQRPNSCHRSRLGMDVERSLRAVHALAQCAVAGSNRQERVEGLVYVVIFPRITEHHHLGVWRNIIVERQSAAVDDVVACRVVDTGISHRGADDSFTQAGRGSIAVSVVCHSVEYGLGAVVVAVLEHRQHNRFQRPPVLCNHLSATGIRLRALTATDIYSGLAELADKDVGELIFVIIFQWQEQWIVIVVPTPSGTPLLVVLETLVGINRSRDTVDTELPYGLCHACDVGLSHSRIHPTYYIYVAVPCAHAVGFAASVGYAGREIVVGTEFLQCRHGRDDLQCRCRSQALQLIVAVETLVVVEVPDLHCAHRRGEQRTVEEVVDAVTDVAFPRLCGPYEAYAVGDGGIVEGAVGDSRLRGVGILVIGWHADNSIGHQRL